MGNGRRGIALPEHCSQHDFKATLICFICLFGSSRETGGHLQDERDGGSGPRGSESGFDIASREQIGLAIFFTSVQGVLI